MFKILVVDDENLVRKGIVMETDWARLDCMVVAEAANGEEGLEAIHKYRPDLVICDIRMPKMDGIEMVTELRNEGNETYVIFLTAYDDFAYAQNAVKLGASDYLLKPFEDGELETALKFAAERGVDVALILPGIPDKAIPYALAKTHYASLLESGVRIYEYTPGFVHAKVFVSDGREAVVGTINLDYRSLYHHFECGVILYKSSQVAVIEQDVQNTLQKCLKMSVADYGKLKLRDRVLARIMRLVAPLL